MQRLATVAVLPLAALTLVSTVAHAQITITREGFPRQAEFIDTTYDLITTQVPMEGPDMVWDYSSASIGTMATEMHFDASGNAYFPGALNYYDSPLGFQSLVIPNDDYEMIDDNGWYRVGQHTTASLNNIMAMTGGARDSLNFPDDAVTVDGPIYDVKFPMTFGEEWTMTQHWSTKFFLTVAAFGVTDVPGARVRTFTDHRSVVGYGKVILPDPNGGAPDTTEVLQLRVDRLLIDSLFLGGAPAPAQLVNAFGLVQGDTTALRYYVWYTNNFGAPLLNINFSDNGSISSAVFRAPTGGIPASIDMLRSLSGRSFPNPVAAGSVVTIPLGTRSTHAGTVMLYDERGNTALRSQYHANAEDAISLRIPDNVVPGAYFFSVHDSDGRLIRHGKLKVE